ncbi:MAG: hypothetical protein CVU05_06565 [Bacteroidetes bacterium HGW-Bacteroidetes-21]|jgi:hypothetical protein|nr:MAG: hypothetical protein CVU05_06565 [Bacteroidetes bacterium HGW-Bacteroidetes-21]
MKFNILYIVFALTANTLFSQTIQKMAAYDSESSYTSGLYCISDTSIYRYSWYYQEWYSLSSDGLTRENDTVRISQLAVYNNKISNSSGLFVFSDTVVLNYNWIVEHWYPLSNTGLPRVFGKPDVQGLTVYGDSGSSSNSTLFALTSAGVYRYSWWYQEWQPISNAGLNTKVMEYPVVPDFGALVFPNPVYGKSVISANLPVHYSGEISIAYFNTSGMMVFIDKFMIEGEQFERAVPSEFLPTGTYICEINAGQIYKAVKMIKR